MDHDNPRSWDNTGTMLAFHKRYILGDNDHGFRSQDYNSWDEMETAILRKFGRDAIILPLYLYDHSGITMATSSFSCKWDSGQVGFIVASVDKVKADNNWKVLTAKRRETATQYLRNEVESYDAYLRGESDDEDEGEDE